MNRDEQLQALRADLAITIEEASSEVEKFMHQTLRPILKFQNTIILASIRQAPHFANLKLAEDQEKQNRTFLKIFLHKNKGLRHQLLGVVSGMFTETELAFYFENVAELNKRIMEMVLTRFLSQLEA